MQDYSYVIERRIFENIDRQRIRAGLSDRALLQRLSEFGIKTNINLISDWRKGKSASFMNYLEELAHILDVTPEELMSTNQENNLTYNQDPLIARLIDLFQNCDEQGQNNILALATRENVRCSEERRKSKVV